MLFNEPKLLKRQHQRSGAGDGRRFSALQRAEIAETPAHRSVAVRYICFSALQRAEIAEIAASAAACASPRGFSALQRAEIAEIGDGLEYNMWLAAFQCSSTSRNC